VFRKLLEDLVGCFLTFFQLTRLIKIQQFPEQRRFLRRKGPLGRCWGHDLSVAGNESEFVCGGMGALDNCSLLCNPPTSAHNASRVSVSALAN